VCPGDAPLLSRRIELAPTPVASRLARRLTDEIAAGSASERLGFVMRLVVSELVNNAVLHGDSSEPILLEIGVCEEWVRIRVRNSGRPVTLESLRRARPPESGRGLDIVDALADAWTIDARPETTTVEVTLRREEHTCAGATPP